jgi:ribosome-binding protein aMBF1 (putative translation factor)
MDFLGYCPYQEGSTINQQIRLHRTHRGLSHRNLAQKIGVDPGSISRWETGDRQPRELMAYRLWEFFEIEPDDMPSGRYESREGFE